MFFTIEQKRILENALLNYADRWNEESEKRVATIGVYDFIRDFEGPFGTGFTEDEKYYLLRGLGMLAEYAPKHRPEILDLKEKVVSMETLPEIVSTEGYDLMIYDTHSGRTSPINNSCADDADMIEYWCRKFPDAILFYTKTNVEAL